MKKRIAKILSVAGIIIISVIYIASCTNTYNSNTIPTGPTDQKGADEQYNGTTDARTEAVPETGIHDTARKTQMEPLNSTGAVPVSTPKK